MKILKRDWKWNVLFLVILFGLFGYVYRGLFHWEMLSIMDMVPWFHTPGEAYGEFSSAWSHLFMGRHIVLGPGDFVTMSSLITLCGGNAAMAQRIFWLSLLPLSAITMRIFLGRFTNSNLTKLIIPLAYAVNGTTIVWFQIGAYATLPAFVFFPLLMLYLIKILEEKEGRWLNMLIFTLIYGLLTNWLLYSLLYFIPFMVIFFLVEVMSRRNREYTVKTSFLFVGSFGILFLLVTPAGMDHLLNIFNYYAKPTGTFGLYGRVPMEHLLFMLEASFNWKETLNMFNSLTYLLAFFALGAVFVRHKIRLRYYLSLLLIAALGMLFAKLVSLGWITDWFTHFPILFTFIHPGKVAMMIAWSFFLMMTILINEVEARIALRHKATL